MNLCAPTVQDVEQVRLWRNNCLETLRTPYPLTKEMQEQFYREVICTRNSKHRYWSISETEDGIEYMIGFGGLTNIEWENRLAEISLIINPEFRRQGKGEQAVELLLREGFNNMNLENIYGECYETNSMQGFWKKVCDKYSGKAVILPQRKYWNGKYYDSLYFSINRNKFVLTLSEIL